MSDTVNENGENGGAQKLVLVKWSGAAGAGAGQSGHWSKVHNILSKLTSEL